MTRAYKTEGVVLSRRNIGEADKLITLFTKHYGKKRIIAKGVRRIHSRRAPHLEVFSYVHVMVYQGKTWDTLTEVVTKGVFPEINTRLERLGFGYIALELTERLTAEHQESDIIFHQLLRFLTQLNDVSTTRTAAETALTAYKQFLMGELGFIEKGVYLEKGALDKQIRDVLEMQLKSNELLTNIQRVL